MFFDTLKPKNQRAERERSGVAVLADADKKTETGRKMETNTRKRAATILLAMGLSLAGASLRAQETRKTLNSPTPTYPETARQFRLSGVVKVQVTIGPEGQITDIKVIGGHPLLVNAVQQTLKSWKYAPASNETTATLVFNFHP